MNTVSEIEGYYKKREQRLLKKLHQQEVALDAANQKLAQLIRNQTAQLDEATEQRAAQDQKLKEELYKDPLTGAYNRRYYEEVVRKSIGPAGIALMDVDDFKICNDTYGHYAGDVALKTVASAIQSCIRSSDLHCRADGIRTRLSAFPCFSEHRWNDPVHHRPCGTYRSPCRLADVSGKGPQECRHGGGSGA